MRVKTLLLAFSIFLSIQCIVGDLASDIDYAAITVNSFSVNCVLFSDYEEFYYYALITDVDPLAKQIYSNLVELQVNATQLKTLSDDYASMLSVSRTTVDKQRHNLDEYVIFLEQVEWDLYNNLTRLKDEDMDIIDAQFVKVQEDFNEADTLLTEINAALFRDTKKCIEGLSGSEVDKIEELLTIISDILRSEYSSVMHARLDLFTRSKGVAVEALNRVIQQLPQTNFVDIL